MNPPTFDYVVASYACVHLTKPCGGLRHSGNLENGGCEDPFEGRTSQIEHTVKIRDFNVWLGKDGGTATGRADCAAPPGDVGTGHFRTT